MTAPIVKKLNREIPEEIARILQNLKRRPRIGDYTDESKMIIASMNKAGQSAKSMSEHLKIDESQIKTITSDIFFDGIKGAMSKKTAHKWSYSYSVGFQFDYRTIAEIAYWINQSDYSAEEISSHFGIRKEVVYSIGRRFPEKVTLSSLKNIPHGLKQIRYRREIK